MKHEALVILVGITADEMKRGQVLRYFSKNLPYDVFLPLLPQRLGIRWCARRLDSYLTRTVQISRYSRVHFLNYISGGAIFRCLSTHRPVANAGRIVYDRGPLQEQVPRVLVRRHGKLPILISRGKMLTDLAALWWDRLPFPASHGEQGLVIEKGVSFLADSLGLSSEAFSENVWDRETLLPGAADVVEIPESHDDVYTSPAVLSSMCHFLQHGKFPRVPP